VYALYRNAGNRDSDYLIGIYETKEDAERAKVFHAHELALEKDSQGFLSMYEECESLFYITEAKPHRAPSENDVLDVLKRALDECDEELQDDLFVLIKNLIEDCKIPLDKVFTTVAEHPDGRKYLRGILVEFLDYVPFELAKKLLRETS
jgi:hypothetical protein